jgi:hypothetical protein
MVCCASVVERSDDFVMIGCDGVSSEKSSPKSGSCWRQER